MLPPKGTKMHWFLTTWWIHLFISMSVLAGLAGYTMTQSFLRNSPYKDMIMPVSDLLWHPLQYFTSWVHAMKLDADYTTEKVAAMRAARISDAQKRRLYRRAHGLEDVEGEKGEQGIDVRGLVPWDDGLTNKERRERRLAPERGSQMIFDGEKQVWVPGEAGYEIRTPYIDAQGKVIGVGPEAQKRAMKAIEEADRKAEEDAGRRAEEDARGPTKKKVKRWLGIWE